MEEGRAIVEEGSVKVVSCRPTCIGDDDEGVGHPVGALFQHLHVIKQASKQAT